MYYYCVCIYTHVCVCCGIRVCASIRTCVCGESMCVYVVCVCIGERTWCVSARVCVVYVSLCVCVMYACMHMNEQRVCVCFRKDDAQRYNWRLQTKIIADCLRIRIKTFIFKTWGRGKKH